MTTAGCSRRHPACVQGTKTPAVLERRKSQQPWPAVSGAAAAAVSTAVAAQVPHALHLAVSAWAVLLAAVVYLTWGSARGELQRPRLLAVQTAGVLGFGAIAVLALSVDDDLGRYVLAGGWLGHAAWDAVHHWAGTVVPRWYAELCLAADLLLAASLILT